MTSSATASRWPATSPRFAVCAARYAHRRESAPARRPPFAAADTLTAHRLELHSTGDNHNEAVAVLRRAQPDGPDLAGHLAALLGLKTKAGYTHRPVSAQERVQAGRRAHVFVDAARTLPLS